MSTRLLVVGVGNPMRGDDGVPHRVIELLAGQAGLELVVSERFVPELAEAVGKHARVVMVDADVRTGVVRLEPAGESAGATAPGHWLGPVHVIDLARRLYGFSGEAWLCRVPARDFSLEGRLSAAGERAAREASGLIIDRALPGCDDDQIPPDAQPRQRACG